MDVPLQVHEIGHYIRGVCPAYQPLCEQATEAILHG